MNSNPTAVNTETTQNFNGEAAQRAGIAVTNAPVVGSCQPSLETQILRRGAEEYALLEREQGNSWERWKYVIRAVLLIDTLAMREAKTNGPKGGKFNNVVAKFLRCYGLDRIHKSDRSRMRKYAGKLEVIDAWRAAQPLETQLKLNHPRVVYDCWSRSQAKAANPSSKPGSNEPDDIDGVAAILAAILADKANDKVVTAAFAAQGLEWFLRVMPADWRVEMETRVVNLQASQNRSGLPHLKASECLRRALSLMKTADTAPITPAVAASNKREALNALQRLNVVLANFKTDEITIVRQYAKERRRAA